MCKARLHTSNQSICKKINEHNHMPDLAKVLADTAVNLLKRKACETSDSSTSIIAEISKNIHISVAAKLPSVNQLKKTASRVRRAGLEHPPNPEKVNNFDIPEIYKLTNDNQQFLIYDSGRWFY